MEVRIYTLHRIIISITCSFYKLTKINVCWAINVYIPLRYVTVAQLTARSQHALFWYKNALHENWVASGIAEVAVCVTCCVGCLVWPTLGKTRLCAQGHHVHSRHGVCVC